jgi:6-phospho-beta-glucosidase
MIAILAYDDAAVGARGRGAMASPTARVPPDQVKQLLESVKASDILAIEAAISGSRKTAVQALQANPLVPDGLAETLVDELIHAHRVYLPQF